VQQRARVTAKLKKPTKAATAAKASTAGGKRKRSEHSNPKTAATAESKFSDYAQYCSGIGHVQAHQWLALRRGAACKELTVTVTVPGDSSSAAAERVVSTLLCYSIILC
jgi:transcriptional accessory protein Tex/SPT6